MGSVWLAILLSLKKIGKTYPKYKLARAVGPLLVHTHHILVQIFPPPWLRLFPFFGDSYGLAVSMS